MVNDGTKIERVAVIGAATFGRRLAGLFAEAGFTTVLEDTLPSKLRRAADRLAGVSFATSIEEAVRDADLAVDCVPDELESKLEIFSLLDRMAPPRTILATPTQGLSIADLASCTYRADRCVAVRFTEGSDGLGLELISTSLTSPEVLDAVERFWKKAGFAVERCADPAEAKVAAGTLF